MIKLGICLIYQGILTQYDFLMELEKDLFTLEKEDNVLTSREIEYLSLIALGFKNRMIADTLFVSKSTVKKTLENIFEDLNAKDRANAVAIAFVHKIITSESLIQIMEKYKLENS